MPRARAQAPDPDLVEEEVEEVEQEGITPLEFDEPLTWRPGKTIAVSDLLRRLKTLGEELATIDQSEADRETLVPKAQELANQQLLTHKDKGVRAWTMLCIVYMFRLLAPDAPYKGGQLKQIFEIFVSSTIMTLADPSDPYYNQHFQVLTSLTLVKSIILMTDINGSEDLIHKLFANCFDVMAGDGKGTRGERLPKNVEFHMTGMLCTLIEECGNGFPAEAIDVVLAQFLRADPNTLHHGKKGENALESREVSPAYSMARTICTTCGDTMDRAIATYFTSVLIDASESGAMEKGAKSKGKKRTHDESEDEEDDGMVTPPAEDQLQEVEKAHRLLRELWRSAPEAVRSVVPSMETEISTENAQLRTMAVQTVGDMIAGIGAAGLPPPRTLNPAAYPSQSLEENSQRSHNENHPLAPFSPLAFSSAHPQTYQAFVDRHRDKSTAVRSAWATACGHIILTDGGGKGLDVEQESEFLQHMANMLVDHDDKVRLAAVRVLGEFDYHTLVQRASKNGGIKTEGSMINNLIDRIRDRKFFVSAPAIEILARLWGVAAGAIGEGSQRIRELLGTIPHRILLAVYSNDKDTTALVQKVLWESLLPLSYPPIKAKAGNGESQRTASDSENTDPDFLRAERILVLVRDLEEKSRAAFFAVMGKQIPMSKFVERFIQLSIDINGEHKGDKQKKTDLEKIIGAITTTFPDKVIATDQLQKFTKSNERRNFQLVRFCISPESDYRKIFNAMKELTKRVGDGPESINNIMDTIAPLVLSASNLVYSRSHVPAIMAISRTDEKGLGATAHEVLKEISAKAPLVFKVHVRELCESLKKQAPSAKATNDTGAVDTLKACSGFARKFSEEMPTDRDFHQAMVAFAMYGTPQAAKHAVNVLMASTDKKEMYIKRLLKFCLDGFDLDGDHVLSKLATLSQLKSIAGKETEDQDDEIMELAADKVLAVPMPADDIEVEWTDEVDDDLSARLWALKILVNGLRGMDTSGELEDAIQRTQPVADKVYKLLNTIIKQDGEINTSQPMPAHHKSRLRLEAAIQLLKLACTPVFNRQFAEADFNRMAKMAQDPLPEVRAGFASALKKYLGQSKLSNRYYGFVFLYAFEPSKPLKESTMTWLKGRAAIAVRQEDTAMESVFARFLSLLAHHQDFSKAPEDLEDFVEYIMFYLKCVATEANLPLIYHIAQRLKTVQDAIDPEKSEHLYIISDLAEATIRQFQESHHWSLQLYGGSIRLPVSIFSKISSHALAHEIAEKRFAPQEALDRVEDIVKASLRTKKRKSDSSSAHIAKKPKTSGEHKPKKAARKPSKAAKTSAKRRGSDIPASERRKSGRKSNAKNYAEEDDSDADEMDVDLEADDDDEVEEVEEEEEDNDLDGNKENEHISSSTPPTSHPTPAKSAEPAKKRAKTTPASEAKKTSRALPSRGRSTRGKKANEEDHELSE